MAHRGRRRRTVLVSPRWSTRLLGIWGVSAGKALLGLRVLSLDDGRPVGLPRALLRTVLLGLATLPTFGFGLAALAWTAITDPGGSRRGWHDLQQRSLVVDVRPPPRVEARGCGATA